MAIPRLLERMKIDLQQNSECPPAAAATATATAMQEQ